MGFFLKEWHKAVKEWEFIVHETKKRVFLRFLTILVIVLIYFFYVAHRFGGGEGFVITLLTWSFFVFCTPIADAGILIDFPVRLLAKVRMVYTEIAVWVLAGLVNAYALLTNPSLYDDTVLLNLFHHILSQPWPFWLIIVLSGIGTFLSVIFADELVDVTEERHRHLHRKHRLKLKMIVMIVILVFIFILYDFLLKWMGVNIPLL